MATRNMYQMTLPELNAELDRLYARQYGLECICVYEMDQDEYTLWADTYNNLLERIMELECRQDEMAPQGWTPADDNLRWVQRQAGY